MLCSMTGYGRAQQIRNGRDITMELRSVNNRYLDLSIKLPRLYTFAEEAIRTRLQGRLNRGKVDVYVTIRDAGAEQSQISLNRSVLEGYLTAMREMVRDYGVQDDISAAALSRFSDVFTVEKAEEDEQQVKTDLLAVLDQALDAFVAMRQREGAALEKDLTAKCGTVLDLVDQVAQRSPATVAEYRTKLYDKMQEVLQSATIDESRILTEAAIYADKVAVDEEITRLKSHVDQMRSMLSAGGSVGRKLDFLMQEMNREANTIGSKGNDVAIARIVVDLKAELEKMREQIQNLE